MDLPVEYNLYGMSKKEAGRFKGLGYPCPEFWEIAAETGCKAIIGVDAHAPGMLLDTDRQKKARAFLDALQMDVVDVLPGLN